MARRGAAALLFLLAAPAAAQQPDLWDADCVAQLLAVASAVAADGLDPAAYDTAPVRAAQASGDAAALDAAAGALALEVARDFARGHAAATPGDWLIRRPAAEPMALGAAIADGLARHKVADAITALLPADARYAVLRKALGQMKPSDPRRTAVIASLERWRWLPRDLGSRRIEVNVPAFLLTLYDAGMPAERHRVIVGALKDPSPELADRATGVILNPEWVLPSGHLTEVRRRLIVKNAAKQRALGFTWDGEPATATNIRQGPGPHNVLGQVKLELHNPQAIRMHDTDERFLFARKNPLAYSHGCIRIENPLDLAATLLAPTGVDRAAMEAVLAEGKTRTLPIPPLPVWVLYFPAEATADGKVNFWPDLYGRDARVVAALAGR